MSNIMNILRLIVFAVLAITFGKKAAKVFRMVFLSKDQD